MKELLVLGLPLSRFISNALVVIICASIIGVGCCYYKRCYLQLKAISENIGTVIEQLSEYSRINASANYENIRSILISNPYLKEAWRSYQKTIFYMEYMEDNNFRKIFYSTQSSSEFFFLENIAAAVNLNFWQNLGGIFTGLGIFGTFAGLTVGLFGIDLTKISDKEIAALVSGMNTAFVTSLVGILGALIFNYLHKQVMDELAKSVDELNDKIEDFYAPLSTEQLLVMGYYKQVEQADQFKTFSDNLAVSIGDALNEKLENSQLAGTLQNIEASSIEVENFLKGSLPSVIRDTLRENIEQHLLPVFINLQQAIEQLSSSGQTAIADGIKSGASRELTAFAETLQAMNTNLQDAMDKMQKTSGSVNADLTDAINRVVDRLETQGQNLQGVGNQVAEDMKNTVQLLVSEMAKQQVGMTDTSNKINDELKASMSTMLESMQNSLAAIAEESRQQQINMQNSVSAISNNLGQNLEGVSSHVSEDLKNTVTALVGEMAKQQVGMADTSNKINDDLKASMKAMVESVQQGLSAIAEESKQQQTNMQNSASAISNNLGEKLAEMLEAHAKQVEVIEKQTQSQSNALADTSNRVTTSFVSSLDTIKAEVQKIMDDYAAKNKAENEETINYIKQLKAGLLEQQNMLAKLATQVDSIMTKAATTADKFGAAAVPINSASVELGKRMDTVLNATADYNQAVKSSMVELRTVAQNNTDNIRSLSQEIVAIKDTLNQASKQYTGVNSELDKILSTLNMNLSNYNQKVMENYRNSLQEYSAKLTKAYNELSALVDELQNVIEDVKK